ncbi:hypothetical protein [Embleya scabrispora]|uniref:hypothetical protein n=1 Tax=Embleya scabrispora TaxID=159449 RepID=UPI0003721B91|nr:hypothetical protein [Embleya scabrispora]MYS82689.1 hypothetical protein [Streptomyces sp. SID5474]
MALYNLVLHHIRVHKTTGLRVVGCAVCLRWDKPTPMIKPKFAARLRLQHHVEHELRIVSDDGRLRFADMPSAPRRGRRSAAS